MIAGQRIDARRGISADVRSFSCSASRPGPFGSDRRGCGSCLRSAEQEGCAAGAGRPGDHLVRQRGQHQGHDRLQLPRHLADGPQAGQGGAELQLYNNLFYLGVYGSNVDLTTRPDAEIDFYGGIRPKFGDLAFDFGIWQYYYPGERAFIDAAGVFWTPKNTDFTEVYGKVSYTFAESLTLGANVYYAWDWLGTGASGTYASVTAKYNLPFLEGLSVSGELGHYWLGTTNMAIWSTLPPTNLPDYSYWNAGMSYNWKNVTADIRYHDTTLSKTECFALTADPRGINLATGRSKWCGAAVVATLSFDITASSIGIFAPK